MKPVHFQCRYHWGQDVLEPPVCIEVTHSLRSGEWQHQGLTCKDCRDYLRGQWRRCRLPLTVETKTIVSHKAG